MSQNVIKTLKNTQHDQQTDGLTDRPTNGLTVTWSCVHTARNLQHITCKKSAKSNLQSNMANLSLQFYLPQSPFLNPHSNIDPNLGPNP